MNKPIHTLRGPMSLPTVHRPVGTARLRIRMPYAPDTRAWWHDQLGDLIRPAWNREMKCWEIARSHMREVVEALAERFGAVEVALDFRNSSRCDVRCRDAEGDDCDCQCLGENHGGAAYWRAWIQVGETTLVEPGIVQRILLVERRRR
ncbi:hypothetical protein [Streptacidiphilus neutrinimicus]|uniref:hypothetical protein n=1 Tax=Streptacidiphilus neutrinimicus TaxID=105420 RepID=UPI001F1DD36A|nr:hypothetical protein [Streptacidiphilus neutrinimicus]